MAVERVGDDCVDTEAYARMIAEHHGKTYISPYNDAAVMAGQGTIGHELWEQVPDLGAVFVAIGGGGLISGIGGYLKARNPNIQIVGCSPAASPAMHACLEAGESSTSPVETRSRMPLRVASNPARSPSRRVNESSTAPSWSARPISPRPCGM